MTFFQTKSSCTTLEQMAKECRTSVVASVVLAGSQPYSVELCTVCSGMATGSVLLWCCVELVLMPQP